jgi:ABC-2 type transport system ATP-binding protein
MPATIEVCGVSKHYDEFVAVDNLSISIPQGAIYGLLGPNGAGKTSSIRMMIGITAPDSGEIRMFGEKFRREHLDRVGYLPEERGLYKKMKVLELLVFFAQLKGVEKQEAVKRSKQWLERMELSEWAQKKVEELSKGMQQKVQFVATVLHDPEFLIMDEPASGLDPANALELTKILLELKSAGKTILFSTHRMDQVERLCDSICLINHGRSVLQGNIQEIRAAYGKSSLEIEYEGELPFLNDTRLITSYNNFANFVEAKMAPGADSQELLQLASKTARISRFELVVPSLEQIFIDTVSSPKAEANNA